MDNLGTGAKFGGLLTAEVRIPELELSTQVFLTSPGHAMQVRETDCPAFRGDNGRLALLATYRNACSTELVRQETNCLQAT